MNRNQKYCVAGALIATTAIILAGVVYGWNPVQATLPYCLAIWLTAGAGWLRGNHRWPYSKDQKNIALWALVLSSVAGLVLSWRYGLLGFVCGVIVVSLHAMMGWMWADDTKSHRGNGLAGPSEDTAVNSLSLGRSKNGSGD